MARSIDLFIDSDRPLDGLADELSELTGLVFAPAPDRRRYVMQDGLVVCHLSGHDFLDDDGLPLSEFRYVLATSVPLGTELATSPEVTSLRHVRDRLLEQAGPPCLLVIDLERPDEAEPEAYGDRG